MSNLYEYVYGYGSDRTFARSLAVRRWLAIPKASLIGPEKEYKMFVCSRTAHSRPLLPRQNSQHCRHPPCSSIAPKIQSKIHAGRINHAHTYAG